MSHLNIIKNAPSDKLIHIVEDDIYFPKSFPKNLEKILSQKTYLDWDIIFLSMGMSTNLITIKKFIDLKKSAINSTSKKEIITYIDGKHFVFGNHSYILNPLKKEKVLLILIDNKNNYTLPIDILIKNKIFK